MDHWALRTLDLEPHQPQILQSDRGTGRAIAINLPAGEQLQDHEVHERAYLTVLDGEVSVQAGATVSGAAPLFASHPRGRRGGTPAAPACLSLRPGPGPGQAPRGPRDE